MDPKHRDKVAFVRVCSGKFEKGMKVGGPQRCFVSPTCVCYVVDFVDFVVSS